MNWKFKNCRLSNQVTTVPGVALSDTSRGTGTPAADASSSVVQRQVFHVGKDISPPKPISQPEPEFSDAARGVKYQGVTLLGLIVNAEGIPARIHILSPLGAGLDANAVHTVEIWKFEPAKLKAQPVAVEIAVEVSFRLYEGTLQEPISRFQMKNRKTELKEI